MKRVRIELSSRRRPVPSMAFEHLVIGVRASCEYAFDESQLAVRHKLLVEFENEVRQWIVSRYRPAERGIRLQLEPADAANLKEYLIARSHAAEIASSPLPSHVTLEAEASQEGSLVQSIFDWLME